MTPETKIEKVNVRVIGSDGKLAEPALTPKVIRTDDEWKQQLTPEQYRITRNQGTEPAFCGGLLDNKGEGIYHCICCDLPIFASDAKFDSGTGWPSFFQTVGPENVHERSDNSLGRACTEILCQRCDAHLGHVFEDGPRPTGLRYCLNSDSMQFVETDQLATYGKVR